MQKEKDLRLSLFNLLLTSPHRNLDELYPVHQEVLEKDPLFYQHLAAWYHEKGEIRDHKEMFVAGLVMSKFQGHRDVGLALLRGMPPYEVCRVIDFIKGKKMNPPRSMVTEVKRYLREREADPDRFDSAVIFARKALKRMYALFHIKPSERAQKILFEDNPPEDSKLYALKQIVREGSPSRQAELILRHRIPYRIASTIIKTITPTVLVALIKNMSGQELINNMGSLRRHGAFDNPEVKKLVKERLERAKGDKRVSAYKAKKAVEVAGVSEDLEKDLEKVTEAQVKTKGRITRPTAILVDKSGSMVTAIEVGKRISAMISSICEADLFVYAFDTMAYPVQSEGDSLADWEKAFSGINATGGTSCGVAIESMRRNKEYVEQIVMVTDGGENTPPFFLPSLQVYRRDVNTDPSIFFVKIQGSDYSERLEEQCRREGIMVDSFLFTGDYYSLPGLLPLLSKPSRLELLGEIMNWPLPKRKAA